MKIELVRTMFCDNCFIKHHPVIGDRFALIYPNGLGVSDLKFNPPTQHYGFTPHYINECEYKEDHVLIQAYCMINGCSVDIVKNKRNDNFTIYLRRPKFITLTESNWNALKKYIDNDYSLI